MKKIAIILLVVIFFIGGSALYTVSETQTALKLRLGKIIAVDNKPGLKFKTPFVNNIVKFDNRIQTLDAPAERFLTGEKKNVIVDSYVKWRIADTEQFYKSTGGNMARTNNRLAQIIKTGLKSEFSKRTIADVVSGERSVIMRNITRLAKKILMSLALRLSMYALNVLICLKKYQTLFIVVCRQSVSVLQRNSDQEVQKKQRSSALQLIKNVLLFWLMLTETLKRFEAKVMQFLQIITLNLIIMMQSFIHFIAR